MDRRNSIKIFTLLAICLNTFGQFPVVDKVHPVTGELFDGVILGKIEKIKKLKKKNSYLQRHVTFYNIDNTEKPFDGLTIFQEECHDSTNRFANWAVEQTRSRTIESGISFDLLGIELSVGGDISTEISFSFERWIQATLNIKAVHKPMISYDVWQGQTYIAKYNPTKDELLLEQDPISDFYMDLINPVFFVERTVLETCN